MNKIINYFNNNGLLLNAKKTQCMFIGSRSLLSRIPNNTIIHVNDTQIKPSDSVKNLGLLFDKYMLFDIHITELTKKTFGILMYINRIRNLLSNKARIIVIQTLVLSLINYGMTVWGTTNKTQLKRVQKIQNFSAKVAVGGRSKYDHASPILDELRWLQIRKKCEYEQCVFMFNILTKKYPSWLVNFPSVSDVNQTNTRQQSLLYTRRTNTDNGQRSISVRGPRVWNALPSCMKNIGNVSTFKRRLLNFLLNNDLPF